MVDISMNGIITLQRGDSCCFPIFLNKGSDLYPVRYILQPGDEIYFSLLEPNQAFDEGVLRIILTYEDLNINNDPVLRLTPENTQNLLPGKYYYEIKGKFNNSNIHINYILNIESYSVLKKGSMITKGSKILGELVELLDNDYIVKINDSCYSVVNDVELQTNDSINYNSCIKAGSIINNEEIKTDEIINTVVKKTQFYVE